MKRSLVAVFFAMSAATVFASNGQYGNEAGEQDFHAPIASTQQYRNDAGEQDSTSPIASNDSYRNEAGQQDEHFPQIG
jgi:hypothetical protein